LRREPIENSSRRHAIAIADAYERFGDRSLHRALPDGIDSGAAQGESEHRAPAVARIGGADQQSVRDQSLEDASQCARVDMQHRRQITSRQPREQTDNTQHEPLWTSDSNLPGHAFGRPFQSMNDSPQQLHELQHVRQLCVLRPASPHDDCRHII
jgi:hypothetical protein